MVFDNFTLSTSGGDNAPCDIAINAVVDIHEIPAKVKYSQNVKSVCPTTRDGFGDLQELYWHPLKNWDVRWNFEKFLIDPWGRPYMRYDPSSEPISKITTDIEAFTHFEL